MLNDLGEWRIWNFESGGLIPQYFLVEFVNGEMVDFSEDLLKDNAIFMEPLVINQVGAHSGAIDDAWDSGPALSRCADLVHPEVLGKGLGTHSVGSGCSSIPMETPLSISYGL